MALGSDGRCMGVDDELGSGRTDESQSNGNQEKYLKAN